MGQCATKPDSSNTPTTGKLSRSRSLTLTSLPSLSHEEPASSVMEEHQSNDEYSDDFDDEEEEEEEEDSSLHNDEASQPELMTGLASLRDQDNDSLRLSKL